MKWGPYTKFIPNFNALGIKAGDTTACGETNGDHGVARGAAFGTDLQPRSSMGRERGPPTKTHPRAPQHIVFESHCPCLTQRYARGTQGIRLQNNCPK